MSLLNPHAVLDTVGVIGGAVARAGGRVASRRSRAGAVTASWLWFLFLARCSRRASIEAVAVRPASGSPRASGALMLVFAVVLATRLA